MAKRRMFSLDVVDTDSFLDLPASSQSLYFHLGMRADDDGFVSSPKRITAMVGAAGDDLKLLIAKGFVIPFESGVCVIRDWRVNNYIQRDRYTPSIYTEEKQRLSIAENGRYSHVDTQCIQDVSKSDTQVRIDTDALGRAQEALQRLAEENTRGDSQTLTAVLMQLGYRVSEQVGGRVPCVASGLLRFDKLLGGGFINGGLHVIGARPAVGKSALALQIALNAARNGVKVLYLSLEMSAEDCSARLVGNIGGLSSARLMFGGRLTDNEYTRFAEGTTALSALPLVFNKRTGMNVRQVEALAYREKPGLLILDHLGLLEPPEARLSLYEATTRNSRALKLLALRLNIPVLCLCQLNRAAASDRSGSFRATMANLRESGAIEQDADTVTLLHNPPCETGERMESPSLLELWLDKNRRGATGHVDATFYKVTGRVTA